jgi:predicted Zn-dependent protease with MMP-like domain
VTPQVFHKHVAKALEEIPEEFQEKMENVEVLIEDFADPETLRSVGLESPWGLLGLYVGVPLSQRSVFGPGYLPERIYLYRRPILRAAGGPQNVVSTIREVVIHEIGHHFGFDDDELERMTGRTN